MIRLAGAPLQFWGTNHTSFGAPTESFGYCQRDMTSSAACQKLQGEVSTQQRSHWRVPAPGQWEVPTLTNWSPQSCRSTQVVNARYGGGILQLATTGNGLLEPMDWRTASFLLGTRIRPLCRALHNAECL